MGEAASYFYDANDVEKQTLHKRVTPNDSQFDEQQVRWNALAEFLVDDLKECSGYRIRTWLQGSYKFGTQVRPVNMSEEFDIDLGIYYCWNSDRTSGRFSPRELKKLVQASIARFAAKNEDVIEVVEPAKLRCCRVRFKGNFHIDIPSYHLNEERDERALATEDDNWEDSDPKAIYIWFKNQFKDDRRIQIRRLLRYLKAWAALKFRDVGGRPSSILLTVLVAEASHQILGELPSKDDAALAAVLREISARLSDVRDVPNPVDKTENLASRLPEAEWEAFVKKLEAFSNTAASAVRDQDALIACSRWAVEFEHLFPLPDVKQLDELVKTLPAVRTLPEVRVSAISRENPNLRYTGVNGIGPIPKNCSIKFEVINGVSMPSGTQFYWVVRNEGDEAEDLNDLGHTGGIGLTAEERSAYKGSHFMDCTAVLGGRIVGLRRVHVKISGATFPRRRSERGALIRLLGRR